MIEFIPILVIIYMTIGVFSITGEDMDKNYNLFEFAIRIFIWPFYRSKR